MSDSDFYDRVYSKLKKVPKGKVTTYKELAHAVGTKAYRAIGTCMNKNPDAPIVPCHRVVNSDGRIGGYGFGVAKKIEILASEGVFVEDGKVVDFKKKLFTF